MDQINIQIDANVADSAVGKDKNVRTKKDIEKDIEKGIDDRGESHGNGFAENETGVDGVPTEINQTVTVEVHFQEDLMMKVLYNPS